MKNILVATDFSTRSDRALRRAILMARQFQAEIKLVHAVDDDQPEVVVKMQQREAERLLQQLAVTIKESDNVPCSHHLAIGDPFRALVDFSETARPDIMLLGPHRRSILRDVFVGTTAERTLRDSGVPIIMANGIPARPYTRILLTTDFSSCSATAIMTAQELGFLSGTEIYALHVFDAPNRTVMRRTSMTVDQINNYVHEERMKAESEMNAFFAKLNIRPAQSLLEVADLSLAEMVRTKAQDLRPDLIVIGTRGRSGIDKFFLGSVAENIMHIADIDILAVPPSVASRNAA